MKLRSVVFEELQQSQYAQSILKKRASSGIVHHVRKYDTLTASTLEYNFSSNPFDLNYRYIINLDNLYNIPRIILNFMASASYIELDRKSTRLNSSHVKISY